MTLKRSTVLTALLIIVFSIGLFSTQAASTNLTWTVTCDGFASNGGTLTFDRDNTGRNAERIIIVATDGNNDVIFDPLTDEAAVGTSVYIDSSVDYVWTRQPSANPLTLTVRSVSGNGLAEQVLFSGSYDCPSYVTASLTPVTPPPASVVGGVSPSVGLNTVPPYGISLARTVVEPGYLYVDRVTANIRSGDDVIYTVVGRVQAGTRLVVRGVNANRTWWFVESNDIRGWISNQLVIVSGDLTGTPIIISEGELAKPTFFLFSERSLLIAPRARSLALCTVPGNLEYPVVGRTLDFGWYELEVSCSGISVTGWVPASSGGIRDAGGRLVIPVAR